MSFISICFAVFFICSIILYYSLPRWQKPILLLSSCVFIGYYHLFFLFVALGISLLTFALGRAIHSASTDKRATVTLFSSIALLAFVWLVMRYPFLIPKDKFLFPLGISFYTFQALSYLIDIYWGDEEPEKNVWNFLIYMMFFMKFLSGPIERAGNFLPQLRKNHQFDYDMVTFGLRLMFIGIIKKVVIADNMASYLDAQYASLATSSGAQLIMTCLLYPIQLYADFSGYTDMAIGGAAMFGIKLAPNFDRPFISKSTSELWRRWHMSLSFWVRDYVYVPLTSVTRGMGLKGVALSLLITFTVLGLWHGAGWNYIVYGMIQGVIIIYEMLTANFHARLAKKMGKGLYATVFIIRTYLLYALSLVFFRAESLSDAIYFITHLSFRLNGSWKEINLGMSDHVCLVSGITFVLVLIFEYFNSRFDMLHHMRKYPVAIRWSVYYVLLFALFAYGAFNSDSFVYLQF